LAKVDVSIRTKRTLRQDRKIKQQHTRQTTQRNTQTTKSW